LKFISLNKAKLGKKDLGELVARYAIRKVRRFVGIGEREILSLKTLVALFVICLILILRLLGDT
jgi:hypothetical protein